MQDYYWVVWLLTVFSWIAVPFFNHFLNSLRDRRAAYNSCLDDLSALFDEMNQVAKDYFSKEDWPVDSFYQLLSHNERMKFMLRTLKQIDSKYGYPDSLVINVRKITTDDNYREELGIHGMRELIAVQTRILDAAPKKVRWF